MRGIDIAGRTVGPGHPCFIIAEAGVNHNGDLRTALRLVDAAADAGANAVKFQTFKADRLVCPGAPKADYQKAAGRPGETQHAMLRRLELSGEDHLIIRQRCRLKGVVFLSTPFDEKSADLLRDLQVPAFKLGSGELTNLPLLAHVARMRRPILLSTGMSSMDEVAAAVRAVRREGNNRIVLLHCVTRYPADPADVNLRAMQALAKHFGVPVGYSDHTLGPSVAVAAVALGACVIEKHFTLDRAMPGPDHRASEEPGELKDLVRAVRVVESAMGNGVKKPSAKEIAMRAVARRSLVAARAIARGERLGARDLEARRPGSGLSPARIREVIGRTAKHDIACGTLVRLSMLVPMPVSRGTDRRKGRKGNRG